MKCAHVATARVGDLRERGFDLAEVQATQLAGERSFGAPTSDVRRDRARLFDRGAELVIDREPLERRRRELHQLAREVGRSIAGPARLAACDLSRRSGVIVSAAHLPCIFARLDCESRLAGHPLPALRWPDVTGTQVGAYRLLEQIGAGGMGAVWLAEHAMLGRRAAVKVLHKDYSARSEIVSRFFNEARAATAISDPGIVQIFDFGHHTDGTAYIVMELLEGETLDRRIRSRGPMQPTDALRVIRQVATSLAAAHARGIVHRDLKPENVFLVRDMEVVGGERAKILDFGIAKLQGDRQGWRTETAQVMGTPLYMSPEQCRGAGMVDHRTDIYSLGCVLFVLLTGRPPFIAEGAGELIAMHLRE